VIPVAVGIGAALVILLVGWLIVSGVRGFWRAHSQRAEKRRLARMRRSERKHPSEVEQAVLVRKAQQNLVEARREASTIVKEAEQKASEIVATAASTRQALLGGAQESAGRAAAEIKKDAKRTASAIVKEAEQKASEIVAAAERERKLAEEKRSELSALLLGLLAEIQGATGARATNVHALHEAQETRSSRAGSAE
jgi:cell division septum initiation protein DivIVA